MRNNTSKQSKVVTVFSWAKCHEDIWGSACVGVLVSLRHCGDEKSLLYLLWIEPQIFNLWYRLQCRKGIVRGAQFYAHGSVTVTVLYWRWRQQDPPKQCVVSTGLHGVVFRMTLILKAACRWQNRPYKFRQSHFELKDIDLVSTRILRATKRN